MNKIITSLALLLFFSCSNAPEKIKESNENKDIEQLRTDYLNKKNWMSPEDMEILSKCFIPYEERAPMDETQRKNHVIECLKKANLSENRINNMVNSVEKIIGGKTGLWNYEYIIANFENNKREMSKDSSWLKIDMDYHNQIVK